MTDEQELLEDIERCLFRGTKRWPGDGKLSVDFRGTEAVKVSEILNLIEKARASGVIRYPRP